MQRSLEVVVKKIDYRPNEFTVLVTLNGVCYLCFCNDTGDDQEWEDGDTEPPRWIKKIVKNLLKSE